MLTLLHHGLVWAADRRTGIYRMDARPRLIQFPHEKFLGLLARSRLAWRRPVSSQTRLIYERALRGIGWKAAGLVQPMATEVHAMTEDATAGDARPRAALVELSRIRRVPVELLDAMFVASLHGAESGRWPLEADAIRQVEHFLRGARTASVRVYARFLAVPEQCLRASLVAAGTRPDSGDRLTRKVRWELWRYLACGERASRLNRARECQNAAESNENWGLAEESAEERGGLNLHWDHEQPWQK